MITCYDKKGRPIMAGDLVRSYHYRDRRWGHQYLYHVAYDVGGECLEMRPATDPAVKCDGGTFWLTQEHADDLEIIHAGCRYPANIFQARARL